MSFRLAPDFFIAGAMKAGTTTLHTKLCSHPRIFIPKGELKYFSIDDPLLQPEIVFNQTTGFGNYKFESAEMESWYRQRFEAAEDDMLIGEDSPVYLASPLAASRIKERRPDAKFIISLRDPVKRLLSQYWHSMGKGRSVYSLSDQLRSHPHELLNRSYYKDSIQCYLQIFPPEQFCFVLFEEFIEKPMPVLQSISRFLGVAATDFPSLDIPHSNTTSYPRYPKLRRFDNWLNRRFTANRHMKSLPEFTTHTPSALNRLLRRLLDRLNPPRANCPESTPEGLINFLVEHLREKNCGLEEMTGLNLKGHWLGW